jgi:hypothetical protein
VGTSWGELLIHPRAEQTPWPGVWIFAGVHQPDEKRRADLEGGW